MSWSIVETTDERVKVDLAGGHTATMRALTPTEYRACSRRVKPPAPDVWHHLETMQAAKRTMDDASPEERAARSVWESYLCDLAIEQLCIMVLELDGEPVTDLKALISRVRPVSAAASLVDELSSHAMAINGEGKGLEKKA